MSKRTRDDEPNTSNAPVLLASDKLTGKYLISVSYPYPYLFMNCDNQLLYSPGGGGQYSFWTPRLQDGKVTLEFARFHMIVEACDTILKGLSELKVDEMMRTIQSIPIVQKLPRKPQPAATLDLDTALKEQICRWGRAYPQVELIFNLN